MTFNKRITTAIATGAVLVNALAPVAFAQSLDVTGNGAFSNSTVNVSNNSNTTVSQANNANISNNVSTNASSGGNSTKFNTGGDNAITTGPATTSTSINNQANLNQASLPNCGTCSVGATNVTVQGNGAYSDNGVALNNNHAVTLNQANSANVVNNVDAKANTGKNDSKFNTGGDSLIQTGAATTVVNVTTNANANLATIGGGLPGAAGGSSVAITGNGAFSDNGVALNNNSAVVLGQSNSANVANTVDAKSNTGHNKGKFNTGGDTVITTGAAGTGVTVDNAVNFNFAAVDCGCVLSGLGVNVAGNGAESENGVNSALNSALVNAQGNGANLANDVDGNAKSGNNSSKFGTDGNNAVHAGSSTSVTDVSNQGNVNLLNNGDALTLPGDLGMNFNFDLSGLWLSFGHWLNV